MNKIATLYKYAKLYSGIIKEADVVRDYNYIPKNSVLSNKLANDYWVRRNIILRQPNLTAAEKNEMIKWLNRDTRANIARAQFAFGNKAEEFRKGMQAWRSNTIINTVDTLKPIAGAPGWNEVAGDVAYSMHNQAGNALRQNIAAATNAENALGLITPHIPHVRNYVNNIPRRITGFNDAKNTKAFNSAERSLSATAAAHYDMNNGEILIGQGRPNPHTPIHEGMHGVQVVTPNATNKDIANWANYTTDKNYTNNLYAYKNSNGGITMAPRAYATYDIESGANQLANDYTRKATENLPRRMRNTIRRGVAIEGERTNAQYKRSLGIDPNATIPQGVNNRKFTKAVNAAARMAGVNAKQELGIAETRKLIGRTPLLDRSITMLRSIGTDISPEAEAEIRQGYMQARKRTHNEIKNLKRQVWLDRVKKNPALLEKAKRLGRLSRFVKVGYYKRMYKTFKRLLLQGV